MAALRIGLSLLLTLHLGSGSPTASLSTVSDIDERLVENAILVFHEKVWRLHVAKYEAKSNRTGDESDLSN